MFSRLIRFLTHDDDNAYFADLGDHSMPRVGETVVAYKSLADLKHRKDGRELVINRLLAPLPVETNPIYCVGLNYKSHAKEASVRISIASLAIGADQLLSQLNIPKCPPLWTKPWTALAHPDADIPMNNFCAQSLPDYEGEMVFVTTRSVKDVSPEEASGAILGYTVGNDLSCRLFQLPDRSGGQYFFAKAFDKFAPIGAVLVSPEVFVRSSRRLTTRVNGSIVQDADLDQDMIFDAPKILSHMSQGTTIPAYTAVMTGTPCGVGAFRKPKSFLQHGDVVEVAIDGASMLQNKIIFE